MWVGAKVESKKRWSLLKFRNNQDYRTRNLESKCHEIGEDDVCTQHSLEYKIWMVENHPSTAPRLDMWSQRVQECKMIFSGNWPKPTITRSSFKIEWQNSRSLFYSLIDCILLNFFSFNPIDKMKTRFETISNVHWRLRKRKRFYKRLGKILLPSFCLAKSYFQKDK